MLIAPARKATNRGCGRAESKQGGEHERVETLWAARRRERGRVVGSKSVEEALWAQGAREVSKCYLDEEKHLDSPTLVDDDEEQTQGYSIWRETHRSMEFHTWIETAACQQQLLLS